MVNPHRFHVHVVMIDDDEVDVEAVARLITKDVESFAFSAFRDGQEAQAAFCGEFGRRLLADAYLILLDLNMPRMNGFEFLEWLRSHADFRRSLVYVFTTSQALSDLERAYGSFVAGYLTKAHFGSGYMELLPFLNSLRSSISFPPPRSGE